MKNIITITKKEFLDTIRDKRTLFLMVVFPLVLFPVIMSLVGSTSAKQMQKSRQQIIKVGVIEDSVNLALVKQLEHNSQFNVKLQSKGTLLDSLVLQKKIDIGLTTSTLTNTDEQLLHVYYNSTKNFKKNAFIKQLNLVRDSIVNARLANLNLEPHFIKPLPNRLIDVASKKQKFGSEIGGLIPYIFILFCFLGGMYPAIDLFAGEKERGTVETLLSLPVKRSDLLIGKLMVVVASGIGSALISVLGLFIGFRMASFMPGDLVQTITAILSPGVLIKLILMLLPLSILLASVLVMFSSYARNYKEAQSSISPLTILVILPALLGIIPGIEMSYQYALVPIVNVSLASKAIISETLNMGMYLVTIASLVMYSVIGIALCSKWYLRESNFLRV